MTSHRSRLAVVCSGGLVVLAAVAFAAVTVPTDVQQPGTQPGEVGNVESPDRCDNCHGGYDLRVEPAHNWRGSAMAQATRDPLFWATVAVAEQDFDGAGDLCLRCHTPEGWLGGRSTPTDGSGLAAGDADGVSCDVCHKLGNPDLSEHVGEQFAPFLAHDEQIPPTGYYGSGMLVMWGGSEKLGPYAETNARHQFLQSRFHRSSELCGTCHDVSNPVVGDLAPGNGAPLPLAPGSYSGVPGRPVDGKAAFNNFPFQYGVVERTFSEHRAGSLSSMRVADYPTLPTELRSGAIQIAYQSALAAGTNGDYEDGTPRTFTCQTCHLRPVTGQGCNKNPPVRDDLPLHDMTGGNFWLPDALQWLDDRGLLRLGGGLTAAERAALADGRARAQAQLAAAASLSVTDDLLRVVNLTGHKLITGYPEGRRMWINVKWFDPSGSLMREDGAYGPMPVLVDGVPGTVETLLDLDDPNGRVYEAHYAIGQAWAARLLELGVPGTLPLTFDRETGEVVMTLGDAAVLPPGSAVETFHFALNDHVAADTRIPPYGMSYDEAVARNTLPVPASQYGGPGPGGSFHHYDEVPLSPPPGAQWADVRLLYQPTSWEYIQFLHLANTGQNPFLADEGQNLLDAWLATGMAAPYEMAAVTWGDPIVVPPPQTTIDGAPADPTNDPTGDFAFSSDDPAATFECSLDGAAFAACASPYATPPLGDGPHAFAVRARDAAGNPDPTPATHAWTVDTAVRSLSINDVTVTEGSSGTVEATFQVMLSAVGGEVVTVLWATLDGTATAPADYLPGSGELVFSPGQTTRTVTVPVNGDTLDEPDETFTVELSAPVNASVLDGAGVTTILDDDPPPNLSAAGASVCEGGVAVVWARLDAASGFEVNVDFQTVDGTALAGSDYVAAAGTATFAVGETRAPIRVNTVGDAETEGSEVFTVALSNPGNAVLLTTSVTVAICDDESGDCIFADGFETGDASDWSAAIP